MAAASVAPGLLRTAAPVEQGIGPVAFYGRYLTEDNQDPETSLGWQLGNAKKFVEPLGGTVAAEFFDIGQSRSVSWEGGAAAAPRGTTCCVVWFGVVCAAARCRARRSGLARITAALLARWLREQQRSLTIRRR